MNRALPLVAALASGVVLAGAFPEPDIAPLAWVSIAPLIVLADRAGPGRGAALGGAFGIGFFGALLAWISIVGWIAWGLLVVLQAAFIAAFGALWGTWSARAGGAARPLGAAVLWVAVGEFLRSIVPVVGFTWGELAQSQHGLPWILRLAGLGGSWLVAFVLVAANALVAEAWLRRRGPGPIRAALVAGAVALIALPALLQAPDADRGDPLTVAIVQGNVPRGFTGSLYDKELAITRSHRRLTESLAGRGVDLAVWPESSVGLDLTRDEAVAGEVAAAARALGAPMVVGGNIDIDDDRYRVVAFEVRPDGSVGEIYDKTHLVPFGEYVPGRALLGGIPMLRQVPRDAVPGDRISLIDVAGGKVAPVLSFEGDFGSLVRTRIDAGGRLLIVATNTSTWEDSWASAQHLAFSRVRAAENGIWVIHAALSGISAVVGPDGRVTGELPLWTAGTLVRPVRFAAEITPYARIGDVVAHACLVATVAGLLWLALRRRRRATG